MTPQELKKSILRNAVFGKLTTGNEWSDEGSDSIFRYLWEVTYWDKKFKNVDRKKQPKVISYSQVLAGDFSTIEDKNGDVFILSTGLYQGYTSESKLSAPPSVGEIVSIPGGGSPSVKYWKGKFVTADNRIATSRDTTILSNKFLYYYMISQVDYLDTLYRGTGLRHPEMALVLDMRIPVPSLSEQDLIVRRIEEFLPLIDRYELAFESLEQFNAHFPWEMQKSILQMAIQGKLVPQDASEGTGEELFSQIQCVKSNLIKEGKIKKERSIPDITEDELPFDIPDSWKWVRLPQIGELNRGRSQHRPRNDPSLYVDGIYPFIQTGEVAQNNFHISTYKVMYNDKGLAQSRLWPKGTLCMTIAANIGDVSILDFDACFPDSVVGFNAYPPLESNLFFLYGLMCYKPILDSMSHSTAQKNINIEILSSLAFPLPPLAEQKRIVAKLEEILPLCERLKK